MIFYIIPVLAELILHELFSKWLPIDRIISEGSKFFLFSLFFQACIETFEAGLMINFNCFDTRLFWLGF